MERKLPRLFEPLPAITGRSLRNANFSFSTLAGRRGILSFIGSAATPAHAAIHEALLRLSTGGHLGEAFVVTVTSDSIDSRRLEESARVVVFHDEDQALAHSFGIGEGQPTPPPCSFILDQRLRVFAQETGPDPKTHIARLLANFAQLRMVREIDKGDGWAPVLAVPRVFEPGLCKALMDYYDATGGQPSGFMREKDGRTYGVLDGAFKKRRDCYIDDIELRDACRHRLTRRLVPEIKRAFQFHVTHIERDIVACYDGNEGGYFNAHRDNTTKGTAHRRFAVSINLNAQDFEGGELRFPEFSQATYRPESGGAIVFSCSLQHEATPVTKGQRYCYLPFLYDEAAAKIRQDNLAFLDPRTYSADETTVLHDPAASSKLKEA